MGRFKPLEKILTNVVDTLGNKIGALPSPNVLFDEYNIALKNKMVSKIKGIVEDMPNTMNLPYEIGQKLNSEGKLPLPIGTSLLPSGRKGYPDEVHKIIGHKGNIYNPDLYGYEIQAPNGDIFFQAISDPKSGLREQRLDKVGSFTAALGPEGVAEMRFVPPSRPVRQFVERSQISEAEQKVIDLGALPKVDTSYRLASPRPKSENLKLHEVDIDNWIYEKDKLYNKEAIDVINKVANKPDAKVTMYRVVPNSDQINDINTGDFVTMSLDKAKQFQNIANRMWDDKKFKMEKGFDINPKGGNSKIISKNVKAKDIVSTDIDINEYGYFPSEE